MKHVNGNIKTIKRYYSEIRITMDNGDAYFNQSGICNGVKSYSIIREAFGKHGIDSSVTVLESDLPEMKKVMKSLTNANKEAVAEKMLELFSKYHGNVSTHLKAEVATVIIRNTISK